MYTCSRGVIHSRIGAPTEIWIGTQTPSVKPRQDPSPSLLRLAAAQDGVLTTGQAAGCGLSRHAVARLVDQAHWRRVGIGVIYTAPNPPPWEALAWAGILVGGDSARLGPESSAYLHQLRSKPPTPIDILTVGQVRAHGPWRFRRDRPGVRLPRSLGAPPRLTVEDAVLDLSQTGTAAETVHLVTKAVQDRLTTPERLLSSLEHRMRHRHRAVLRAILLEVADGANSALELTYCRDVERAHGLPRAQRQKSRLRLPYQSDVGYDEYQLLVELDGRDGHQGSGRFRDMWRDNRFALRAWLTLRYGWFDVVDRPCLVALQVWSALAERGWPQPFQRCSRCRNVPEAELLSLR